MGSTQPEPFRVPLGAHQPATPGYQLRSLAYEIVLMVITLGIGGLIWSWVAAFSGQTPASKFRDEVLVNVRSSQLAAPWRIIVRQTLLFASIVYVVLGAIVGFGILIDVGGYWIATAVIPAVLLSLMLLDVLLIFSPLRRRLIDWVLFIKPVDGGGYAFRKFKS